MDPLAYIDELKQNLAISPIIATADIVQEFCLKDRGFFRARLTLTNTDFIEIAEFFVIEHRRVSTVEYRFQWMDASKQQLRKRWDNAPHYPDLPNLPHHVHIGDEEHAEPGAPISTLQLLEILEQELDAPFPAE